MTAEQIHHIGLAWSKLTEQWLDAQVALRLAEQSRLPTVDKLRGRVTSLAERIERAERLMIRPS